MDTKSVDPFLTPTKMPVFTETANALECLQRSLQCKKCEHFQKDVFTLGQCEHRFCSSCAEDNQGKACPVCKMPSHATQVHVDKQLSNIAALCQQVSNLLSGTQAFSTPKTDHDGKTCESDVEMEPTFQNELRGVYNFEQGAKLSSGKKRFKQQKEEEERTKMQRKRQSNQHTLDTSTKYTECQKKENNVSSARKRGKSGKLSDTTSKNPSKINSEQLPVTSASSKYPENEENFSCSRKSDLAQPNKRKIPKLLPKVEGHRHSTPLSRVHTKVEMSPGPRRRGRKSGPVADDSVISTLLTPKHDENKANSSQKKNVNSNTRSGSGAKPKAYFTKRNAKGETPLQVATIKGDVVTVRKLLQEGANPNVRDNAGWTPLHEAVNHGNAEVAEILISHGAAVNSPGLDNDTPLHDAVSNYRLDCVKLLISKGANAESRNIHGKTPLDMAQTDEMRVLLLTTDPSSVVASGVSMIEEEAQQPLCISASVLSREKQALLQKCARLLHAKILSDFTPEVTHLITDVNGEGMCPRTFKYMSAILAGKWIVNTEWLSACLEYGKRVSEEAFEIAGCSTNPDTLAPQKARHNRLQQLPGLFDGCQFYFHGKFNYPTPSREALVNLVKLGGGVLLTREPRLHNLDDYPYTVPFHAPASSSLADCAIFVVYDDTCPDPPKVEAQRMSCLPVSWLMNSVASYTLLDKWNFLK